MRRFFYFFLSALVTAMTLLIAWSAHQYFWHALSDQKQPPIVVRSGENMRHLVQALAEMHAVPSAWHWLLWSRLLGQATHLQPGQYALPADITPNQLVNNITQGRVIRYHLMFVEGVQFRDMRAQLAQAPWLDHDVSSLSSTQLMQVVAGRQMLPEGQFFPSTYRYHYQTRESEILQRAYQKMQAVLQQAWSARAPDLPYANAQAALIMASLIEAEASVPKERPVIASVLVNRLRKKMRLQVDPTVMYAVGKKFGSTLTKTDLKNMSPYNTYRHAGLPPTPIDMPGRAAIMAALHPAQTNYLYYVASNDGHHIFSTNYTDHLRAVNQYQRQAS